MQTFQEKEVFFCSENYKKICRVIFLPKRLDGPNEKMGLFKNFVSQTRKHVVKGA